MKMQIISTTDNLNVGNIFDSDDNPILLDNDSKLFIDKIYRYVGGAIFSNSNYVIDAKEM